jgi:hypothetical protein
MIFENKSKVVKAFFSECGFRSWVLDLYWFSKNQAVVKKLILTFNFDFFPVTYLFSL